MSAGILHISVCATDRGAGTSDDAEVEQMRRIPPARAIIVCSDAGRACIHYIAEPGRALKALGCNCTMGFGDV